jgi:hypothetical protein
MRRLVLFTVFALLTATAAFAHHSYGEYDQEHPVSIAGTIQQLVIGSPHSVMRLRTDNNVVYTMVWGNAAQLARWGVTPGTLRAGDRIVVTGAEMRDRSFHTVSLISEIRRPADGWRWTRASASLSPTGPTGRESVPVRR